MQISEITTIEALKTFLKSPVVSEAISYLTLLPVSYEDGKIIYHIQGLDESEVRYMGWDVAVLSEKYLPKESVMSIEGRNLCMDYNLDTRDLHQLVADIRAIREFYNEERNLRIGVQEVGGFAIRPPIGNIYKKVVNLDDLPLVSAFGRFGIDANIMEKVFDTNSVALQRTADVNPYKDRENIVRLNQLIDLCCTIGNTGHER